MAIHFIDGTLLLKTLLQYKIPKNTTQLSEKHIQKFVPLSTPDIINLSPNNYLISHTNKKFY